MVSCLSLYACPLITVKLPRPSDRILVVGVAEFLRAACICRLTTWEAGIGRREFASDRELSRVVVLPEMAILLSICDESWIVHRHQCLLQRATFRLLYTCNWAIEERTTCGIGLKMVKRVQNGWVEWLRRVSYCLRCLEMWVLWKAHLTCAERIILYISHFLAFFHNCSSVVAYWSCSAFILSHCTLGVRNLTAEKSNIIVQFCTARLAHRAVYSIWGSVFREVWDDDDIVRIA